MNLERIKSGIHGLDELLEGGFPKGSCILISGEPGTGKTIFGLQFLYQGLKENKKGTYITFEQEIQGLFTQGNRFGWNLQKFVEEGKLDLLCSDVKDFKIDSVVEDIKNKGTERLVIDSLSSLLSHPIAWEDIDPYYMLTNKLERLVPSPLYNIVIVTRILLRKIMTDLKRIECTSLLTSELVGGSKGFSRDTISEFLVDGVILLNYMIVGGEYSRNLMIQKLRSTKHSENIHPIEIKDGTGMSILKL